MDDLTEYQIAYLDLPTNHSQAVPRLSGLRDD